MSILPSSLIPWHSLFNILHALTVPPIAFLLIPLDLTILITFGEWYRLPSFILCQFLQYFASSPLLNPAKQETADKENFCPALLVVCPMNWRFIFWTDDSFNWVHKQEQVSLPELPAGQQALQDVNETALILYASFHETQTSFQRVYFLKNHS